MHTGFVIHLLSGALKDCLLNPDDTFHYLKISKSFVTRHSGPLEQLMQDTETIVEFYRYSIETRPYQMVFRKPLPTGVSRNSPKIET